MEHTTTADASIRPFRIEIPQADLDDLAELNRHPQFTTTIDGQGRRRSRRRVPRGGSVDSGPLSGPGWTHGRTRAAFVELMAGLGHDRYGVQSGDVARSSPRRWAGSSTSRTT